MDPALPPNWRSARAADGKEYYFNELTGETSWTVPTAPASTVDEVEASTAPADAPTPALTSDPWASAPRVIGLGDDGKAKPSVQAEIVGVSRADSVTSDDIQVMRSGRSNFYDSLGPGGFKLLIVIFSSIVVLIESSILVDKLKVARQNVDAIDEDSPLVITETESGKNVTVSESLQRACQQAGSLTGLSLELVVGGLSPDPDNTNYGVAVGTVSLVLTATFMCMAKFRPAVLARFSLPLPKNMGMLSAQQVFYGFLLLWWGPGTGVLTFHGPYRTTGNPYFACWAALICSVMLCADAFTKMKVGMDHLKGGESAYHREMLGLWVASVTLFFASLDFVSHGTGAFGVSLGIISALISVVATYLVDTKKIGAPIRKAVSAVLFVLWFAAAVILTFDSPFTSTGNGYFACWFGLACSTLWVYREFLEMQVQFVDGRFKSISCRTPRQELPVVAERIGA